MQLRNYEIREERNKQALGYLAKPDAESKVWYCAGDFFIHLPKQKAEGLVQRGTRHPREKTQLSPALTVACDNSRPRQRSVRGRGNTRTDQEQDRGATAARQVALAP